MSCELKSSGVDWIGDVPVHWRVGRADAQITNLATGSEDANFSDSEGQYPFHTCGRPVLTCCKPEFFGSAILLSGNGDLSNIKLVNHPDGFNAYQRVYVLKVHKNACEPYLYWSFVSGFTKFVSTSQKGSVIEFIRLGDVKKFLHPVPPLQEQITIAAYLDKATATIDKQRDLLERKKALLQEQKKAVIHDAVTKGLKPGVPMKPSGVDWIGDVPAGWKMIRIKDSCIVKNGDWGSDPIGDGSDLTCYRKADFDENSYVNYGDTKRSIRRSAFVVRNDILMEKSGGGDLNPVGSVAFVASNEPSACSNFLTRMRARNGFDAKFLFYIFRAQYSSSHIYKLFNQTTGIQNINVSAFLQSRICIPNYLEQVGIAKDLDAACSCIEKQCELIDRKIELLGKLRESTIHEAVTKGVSAATV